MQDINEFLRDKLNSLGGNIYVAPEIPKKKIDNAIKEFDFDADVNSIVAIYDNSLLGNVKDGLLFVGSGFYIKNKDSVKKVDFSQIKKVSLSQEDSIIIMLNNEDFISMPRIVSSKFSASGFVEVINEVISNFDSFEDAHQNVAIENMDEDLKIAYMSIMVRMTLDDDGIIDEKEISELLLLMTRLKLKSESRNKVRASIAYPEEVLAVEDLLKVIETKAPAGQLRNLHISLYKDLVNIHSSSKEKFNDQFRFLNNILPKINITEEDKGIVKQAILNDRAVLDDETTDSEIIENMKKLSMNAAAVGTPLAAIYISGSVMGLSAAGITSGLATLGMGGLLGMSGMVTGIGVIVLLGVGTYHGLRKMTGTDVIAKHEKRRLMLNEIIKQNQEALSLLMNDINGIVTQLNDAIKNNYNNEDNIAKLVGMLKTMSRGGKALGDIKDNVQSQVYKSKCPTILDLAKLNDLTISPSMQQHKVFILEYYYQTTAKKKVKDNEGNESFEAVEVLTLKKEINVDHAEELMQVFDIIGYFNTSDVLSAKTRSGATKLKGVFTSYKEKYDSNEHSESDDSDNLNTDSSSKNNSFEGIEEDRDYKQLENNNSDTLSLQKHNFEASIDEVDEKLPKNQEESSILSKEAKDKIHESAEKTKKSVEKTRSMLKGFFK
ncbi:hypothetical protein [Psychrobacter sp. LV10R520-6]|uniref:hypothetical protein n=1 Tax=Psychrobacter sp. LV10R520-6 TaxID=1415574 RepID=UPI0024C82D55|nr:hypothetical protein [Psychrobacter sp. LV10R520-6]SNT70095.1 hypothetical protein SAMN04488491_1232 [Psychrobacter sp. LV10R520-6]